MRRQQQGKFCRRHGVGAPGSVPAERGCYNQCSRLSSTGSLAGRLKGDRTEHGTAGSGSICSIFIERGRKPEGGIGERSKGV